MRSSTRASAFGEEQKAFCGTKISFLKTFVTNLPSGRLLYCMHQQIFQQQVLPVRDKLFRLSFRLLGNTEDAKDVVQEVMLRVWHHRKQMEEYKSIEAWCMQIAKNLCLDKLKSREVRQKSRPQPMGQEPADDGSTPLQYTERQQQRLQLRALMDRLPAKQQMTLHLRDIEGFSYKEIAEITAMSMEEVKVNLFRGRKALKELLLKIHSYGL